MMKTTLTGRFLGMTMLAGLLMAPFAIGQNEDQPEVLPHAVHQRQLGEGGIQNYANALLNPGQCILHDYASQSSRVAAAGTRLAVPAQPIGPSNGSTIVVALIPVAEGPVGVLKTLRLAEPQIVSGVTDLGIPSWLYCKLHPRWCKNF
jgi:hypothetical protein